MEKKEKEKKEEEEKFLLCETIGHWLLRGRCPKTMFLWNISKSQRLALTFFPIILLSDAKQYVTSRKQHFKY